MKHISFRHMLIAMSAIVAISATSCSNDDDKYRSTSPRFSDITFMPDSIHPGDRVTATAVQYKKGKYLDRTTYSWSVSGTTEDVNVSNNKNLFYDDDKSDPTCTFTAPSEPGTYTLEFSGTYNVSAQSKTSGSSVDILSGTIEYSSSPFNCYVTITKRFRVTNP